MYIYFFAEYKELFTHYWRDIFTSVKLQKRGQCPRFRDFIL